MRLEKPNFSDTLESVGKMSRFLFFAITIVQGGIFVASWDRSVGDTPLAQLTLNQLSSAVGKTALSIGAALIWFFWAFASGKRNYRAWGWFGIVALLAVSVIAGYINSQHVGL